MEFFKKRDQKRSVLLTRNECASSPSRWRVDLVRWMKCTKAPGVIYND